MQRNNWRLAEENKFYRELVPLFVNIFQSRTWEGCSNMYNIIFNSSTKRARQTQQVKATWRRSAVSGLVLAATPLFWGIEALVRSQVVTTTTAHLPNFTTTGETIHEERRQEVVLQADSSSRTHRSLAAFSTVEESTILFLHVFKVRLT